MLKTFGILALVGGLLLLVVGAGGAVVNFGSAPTGVVCRMADEDFKNADAAVKKYESIKGKGTPDEYSAKADADAALKRAGASSRTCGTMKERYRSYGMIFAAVGFVGFIGVLLGAVVTFLGFRKKKLT